MTTGREWLHLLSLGEIEWLLIACAITAIVSLPLALRMVPPNAFYGCRTRFTRSSPQVWYDANAFMGRALVASSIASLSMLFLVPLDAGAPWLPTAIVMLPMALAILAGYVYLRHLRETIERR
jgi:uncharacterized membrane protein